MSQFGDELKAALTAADLDADSYDPGERWAACSFAEGYRAALDSSVVRDMAEKLKDAQGYLCSVKCNHEAGNVWHSPACIYRTEALAAYEAARKVGE